MDFKYNKSTGAEIGFNLATMNSSSYVDTFLAFWIGCHGK